MKACSAPRWVFLGESTVMTRGYVKLTNLAVTLQMHSPTARSRNGIDTSGSLDWSKKRERTVNFPLEQSTQRVGHENRSSVNSELHSIKVRLWLHDHDLDIVRPKSIRCSIPITMPTPSPTQPPQPRLDMHRVSTHHPSTAHITTPAPLPTHREVRAIHTTQCR